MDADATPRGLYLLTPDDPDTTSLLERVAPLLPFATWLQYRNKRADAALRERQATALRALCSDAGVPLLVNDDPALAARIDADGAHLGEGDGAIAAARALLGTGAIIGASCYDDPERAAAATAAGASYLAFGALFPSSTKPGARRAGAEQLRAARVHGLPLVAIGGITAENAPLAIEAGADLVAVIGGVFDAPDPAAAARAIHALFHHQPGHR